MDSYQAVYDAVRSKISGGNVSGAVSRALMDADIGHRFTLALQDLSLAGARMGEPSAVYRPELSLDGNQWCALYGKDLMDGVAGFGDTPAEAMADFDKNWRGQKAPTPAHRCSRCQEPNPERFQMDGCADPQCPEQG